VGFWLVLVGLAGTHAWGQQPVNLIPNGGFEREVEGWVLDEGTRQFSRLSVERNDQRGGKVLRLENTSAEGRVAVYQTIPLEPGKTYRLTGFCRSERLQESAGVAFYCFDAAGKLFKRVWVHHIPSWGTYGWKEFQGDFRPPADTAAVQLRLIVYKRGTVLFDDLALAETPARRAQSRQGRPIADGGLAVNRYETKRPVYAMDADDLDGDGALEFVLGDIDGLLRGQSEDGRVLWECDPGGLCFDLDCGDLDGDGRKEIVACTADIGGHLRAMDDRGQTLWSYAVPGTIFGHVTVADLDGDGRCEVFASHDNQLVALSPGGQVLWQASFGGPRFRAMAVGDVTGDGRKEVVASLTSQKLFAAALDGAGKPVWRYQPQEYSRLGTEDIVVADVDGDGRNEVLVACTGGLVLCLRDGETVWEARRERQKLWPQHEEATGNFGSQQSHLTVADFCPDRPGLETLVTLVDTVWMLDQEGKRVWESGSGLLLRRLVPGSERELFVPSSGFRDCGFYRLSFVRGKGNALAEYGVPNPIYAELEKLYARACAMERLPTPESVSGKFHVLYANLAWPSSRWGSYERLQEASDFVKTKESDHLEFIFMLWPKDLPVELHRGGLVEQSEILDVARFFERIGRPFMFFADHGCSPNLSLDTIEKTLRLAPKTCRGMYVAENTAHYPSRKWDEFVSWAMKVMDLCRQYGGKQVVFKEMFESWAFLPADPQVRATLLRPEYRDTIVAMYATNNPYAPELQMGGMVGLKQAGLVSDWGISTQYWNWSWGAHRTNQSNWAICPADVILSMELTAACLGGRWFHIEGGQEYLVRGQGELSPRARRHRDLVYELIRKNVLLPVKDEDNLSFSNVVLVRRSQPLVAQLRRDADAARLGPPYSRPLGPLRSGLLGVNDALQTVAPEYFSAYAYGNRRYIQTMAPATPYGFVRIVPECERVRPFLHGKRSVVTDGNDVFVDGKRVKAADARPLIVAALQEEAGKLPVQAAGAAVFTHGVDGAYRAFLLDPGYMCPLGVETRLRMRHSGGTPAARDLLTGNRLPPTERGVPVEIPAGTFRIIQLESRRQKAQ